MNYTEMTENGWNTAVPDGETGRWEGENDETLRDECDLVIAL